MGGVIKKLEKYKYLLLLAAVGLALILIPTGGGAASDPDSASQEEARLASVLGEIDGVGEVSVLLSDGGAVVVCRGASSAQIRLAVLQAVGAYTGLGGDRITVLQMKSS